MRSKLRVETRLWLAARLAPKKYGEAKQVDGQVTNNVTIVINPANLAALQGGYKKFREVAIHGRN